MNDHLDQLIYCLKAGYPAHVTAALLTLIDDPWSLDDAYRAWDTPWNTNRDFTKSHTFAEAVYEVTEQHVSHCDDCESRVWSEETITVDRDRFVCEGCSEEYTTCDDCGYRVSDTTHIEEYYDYCGRCLGANCSFCDECDDYYRDCNADDHNHGGCECEAPILRFAFPADVGTVANDERLTVKLPKGTIDDEGMNRIRIMLISLRKPDDEYGAYLLDSYTVQKVLEDIGPLWQAKRGNFTRRLSSAFYKDHGGIKLPPDVLSEVGNIARAHSSDEAAWHIEFTRNLNQPPQAFAHEDSCWWSVNDSYGRSRCALKSWGGIGLRSYYSTDDYSDNPTGRVWVQPVDMDLRPTHDTIGAFGYVIFNGYGDLGGYVAARIVAHLTGKTYKKLSLSSDGQYINGESAFLIADESTCNDINHIGFGADVHHQFDADTFLTKAA